MSDDFHDFIVIGGGIVGLSTAMELLKRQPGASVLVVEKERGVAMHQTGHNSGVIHAGIYYAPGSLKAKLCAQGAIRTREFADQHGIPYRNTGKLIVATNDIELERMQALYERAILNGLDVELIDEVELRRREPRIRGLGAIFLRSTGIIDYRAVCRKMCEVIIAGGGEIRLGAHVKAIHEDEHQVDVDIVPPASAEAAGPLRLRTKKLVVCGGIQADRLARMAGLSPEFQMAPFRGEYYRLRPEKNDIVQTLIYPVPDPSVPFLGVHLTPMMDGGVTVGPNAVLGFAREGYPRWAINLRDVADLVRHQGFWRLVPGFLKTGIVEQWNSIYKPGYLKLVQKYCPEIAIDDLLPEPAGIRAQAIMSDGSMAEDFLFMETARMLHVCNAPSPAATSAMPIAQLIVDKVLGESAQLSPDSD